MSIPRGAADIPSDGECFFCFEYCTDIDYCTGCEEFICPDCNENDCEGYGAHDPVEHLVEEDF